MPEIDDLVHAARPLLSRLAGLLDRNPQLRREAADVIRAVADWLTASGPVPPPGATTSREATPAISTVPPPTEVDGITVAKPRWAPFAFTLPGTTQPLAHHPTMSGIDRTPFDDWALVPLDILAQRCRVKSDAAKLVSRRLTTGTTADGAEEADLRHRATALPDCPLWMLAESPYVTAPKIWDDLAGAYTAAASAAELFAAWHHVPDVFRPQIAADVLSLAAESQSLLMYAVADTRGVRQDFEQIQLFVRVREATRTERVFLSRFMKREDRADPATWPSLVSRLNEATEKVKTIEHRDKNRAKHLHNLKFKSKKMQTDPAGGSDEWPRVWELIEELISSGMPASDPELREILLPLLDRVPDDYVPSSAVGLVFREIDKHLAARPSDTVPHIDEPTAEVSEVAKLLSGREIVLIGGHVRPTHKAHLVKAFDLANVRWLSVPEHTSHTVFESDIARPEVALVLLAIRWTSHSYSEVDQYCQKYATPLVRLPGGYGVNQVAHQILAQVGDQIRATRGV